MENKKLIDVLKSNGSGVLEGNFSTNLTFEEFTDCFGNSDDELKDLSKRDKEVVFRLSHGFENLGVLEISLLELKLDDTLFIYKDKNQLNFMVGKVIRVDGYQIFITYKDDFIFGKFIATIH